MNRQQYDDEVRYQRIVGKAQVGVLLDGLCARWGIDPVEAWRGPRVDEELAAARERRWRADVQAITARQIFASAITTSSIIKGTIS